MTFVAGLAVGFGLWFIIIRDEVWAAPFPEARVREIAAIAERYADARKDAIEVRAIRRLAGAMDQSRRTGRPVVVELAGEPVVVAHPPPGTIDPDTWVAN